MSESERIQDIQADGMDPSAPGPIRRVWRRIRGNWNRSDTWVTATNTTAFVLFLGNCGWESLAVVYAATLLPLAFQGLRSIRDAGLRGAWAFGLLAGFLWPFGEWLVVNTLGWWGEYLAPGPRILDTPIYCILIGCLASTHIAYATRRAGEMGFGPRTVIINTGLTAFLLGIIGENLFVAASMWVYDPSIWDWWSVPAFVPTAYGLGYAFLPRLQGLPVVPRVVSFSVLLLVVCVGLGLAVGFFPR